MSFRKIFDAHDWNTLEQEIYAVTEAEVAAVLKKDKVSLDDFKILISPAAKPFLEEMAQRSHELTKKRFGNTIQMYLPMYLSNE